ncbi:hypothetical protein SteCoe_31582 [Stentor coeruleus]|uniref:Protein kinase domain-containing protein n=1 Tax=Stentor coeruleus TaxID=5963 RepID=A0A1R2B0X4_9CILI|nr:hypothetical protein SteCoe_31582 [Stentor coeruleus]
MSEDIMLLIWGELKDKAIRKKDILSASQTALLERAGSLTKTELLEFCDLQDPDLRKFAMGLMLDRICKETPSLQEGPLYHKIILKFIEELPRYKESIANRYKSCLANIISSCATGEDLAIWSIKISELEALQCDINPAKQWLHSKFTSYMFNQADKLRSDFNIENLKKTAISLEIGMSSGIDLKVISNVIFSIGADYVIKKYDLHGLRQNSDQSFSSNYEEIKDLFGDLKRLQFRDNYNIKKLELIENKIECEIPIKPLMQYDPDTIQEVKIKVKKSIPEENLIERGFDKSKVVWRQRPAYQRANEAFGIEVTIGELPNRELVAKKIYSFNSIDDANNVENEIKILTVLSNRATPENSYIKFYGAEIEMVNETEKRIILYMEAHSSSLIDKISEAKRKGELIDEEIVENAARKLVHAFAHMQTLGIYHRDIKPHNILVTDDWNLKIIDFSVSDALKHDDCYTTMTGNTTIQGTHGYMAPEVEDHFSKQEKTGKFRPGRADVFSLGLTLYQLISLRDTYALNIKSSDQYDRIKRLLNQLSCEEWVKILLQEMLNPDYHFRASFKQCLRFLPGSNATVDRTILL